MHDAECPEEREARTTPEATRRAGVRRPNQCRTVLLAGDVNRFVTTGAETGGAFAQWEVVVPPGGGARAHTHTREEEGVLVLEGEIVLDVGGACVHASAGDFANLPLGVAHAFRNVSDAPALLLFTVAPAGLEGFFFEAGVEVSPDWVGEPSRACDERAKMLKAAPKYGIRFVQHTSEENTK